MTALRFLLLIAVLCCGLHVAEPVQAHPGGTHFELAIDHDEPGEFAEADPGHGPDANDLGHAAKHHCPLLTDLPDGVSPDGLPLGKALRNAGKPNPLVPYEIEPPTQPPSA